MVGLRIFGQARHTQDIARYGYNHLRTCIDDYIADLEIEARDGTVKFGMALPMLLPFGLSSPLLFFHLPSIVTPV